MGAIPPLATPRPVCLAPRPCLGLIDCPPNHACLLCVCVSKQTRRHFRAVRTVAEKAMCVRYGLVVAFKQVGPSRATDTGGYSTPRPVCLAPWPCLGLIDCPPKHACRLCVCACGKFKQTAFSCRPSNAHATRNTHAPSPFVNHRWGGAAIRDAWVTRLNAVDTPLLGTHERARLRLPHQTCVFVCVCVWWSLVSHSSPPPCAPPHPSDPARHSTLHAPDTKVRCHTLPPISSAQLMATRTHPLWPRTPSFTARVMVVARLSPLCAPPRPSDPARCARILLVAGRALMMIVLVSLARHPLDTVTLAGFCPWAGGWCALFLARSPTRTPPSLGGAPTRMPSPLPPRPARPRAPCVRVVVVRALCARFLCRSPPTRPSRGLLLRCVCVVSPPPPTIAWCAPGWASVDCPSPRPWDPRARALLPLCLACVCARLIFLLTCSPPARPRGGTRRAQSDTKVRRSTRSTRRLTLPGTKVRRAHPAAILRGACVDAGCACVAPPLHRSPRHHVRMSLGGLCQFDLSARPLTVVGGCGRPRLQAFRGAS